MAGKEKVADVRDKLLKETRTSSSGYGMRAASSASNKSILKGQATLDGNLKKVQFVKEQSREEKREDGGAERRFSEEISKLRSEKVEIEKIKVELQRKNVDLLERIVACEKRVDDVDRRMSDYEAALNECRSEYREFASRCNSESEGGESGEPRRVYRSRDSSVQSRSSVYSTFSELEMKQMKRMLNERDKNERRDNIVIKGLSIKGDNLTKEIGDIIKDKLGLEVNIFAAWARGSIFVAKVGNVEQKIGIMKNKNKLAGTKIFIENDLTFEERKRQDEIIKWVKEQKEKGIKSEVGYGKVQIRDKWFKWEDWKKDLQESRESRTVDSSIEKEEEARLNEAGN